MVEQVANKGVCHRDLVLAITSKGPLLSAEQWFLESVADQQWGNLAGCAGQSIPHPLRLQIRQLF